MTPLTHRLLFAALAAALTLLPVTPSSAAARGGKDDRMKEAVLLRGYLDRRGAEAFWRYPPPEQVARGRLPAPRWPRDPWTGAPLTQGDGRGHFRYTVAPDRRSYRLTGFLSRGSITYTGGMPLLVRKAFDHRSEEAVSLIREYIEDWAEVHRGRYPAPPQVAPHRPLADLRPHLYWPSDPWTHGFMRQGDRPGTFTYTVSPDRRSYTLRLHRDLKQDWVLTGGRADDGSLWITIRSWLRGPS